MILSTPGIVISTTPYNETSVIVKVFTRQLGLRSYIAKGVRGGGSSGRSQSSKRKNSLLQPMNCLEMVVYNSSRSSINHIKEMSFSRQFQQIGTDPVRGSLLFFFNELLYKTLHEEEVNEPLFDFVTSQLDHLDRVGQVNPTLPLVYLLGVARHLGIEPLNNYSHHEPYFNVSEGRYQPPPSGKYLAEHPEMRLMGERPSMLLHHFLESMHGDGTEPLLSYQDRQLLINEILVYYQNHVASFKNFQSHHILHDLLR